MRLSLATMLFLTTSVSAQAGPPDSLVNVQVIPKSTPVSQVIDQMGWITRSLGVGCSFCHVGDRSMNLWDYDFASDEKPTKRKARVMMRMVRAINGDHLPRLAEFESEGLEVTCMTCHRGVRIPQPLHEILVRAHADGGMAGLDSTYDALREQYFGRAAYDFGVLSLDLAAEQLFRLGHREDAVRVYVRNAEFFESSGFAHRRVAAAQLAVGDTTAAVDAYRRALAISADDGQARQALQRLGRMP